MNKRITNKIFLLSLGIFCLINSVIYGQGNNIAKTKPVTDSLQLKSIIETVIKSYPTVKAAQEAINNADAKIGLARTGYYPEADVTANFSNIGPVTKLTIPSMGTFQLYPSNSYSAAINYRQVIYDFGRTRENIELEKENKAIGEQTLEQVKQKLSLFAVNNFYTLVFLQAAITIKNEQIEALNEHLKFVEKMMATGSATEYQVLTTEVSISTVESQKVDLLAALASQQSSLNSLLGTNYQTNPVVKNDLTVDVPVIPSDSAISFAFRNRDEVIINEKRTTLAELRYDMTKLQNKPVLNFIASAGGKNGYIPDMGKVVANYVLGIGIKVPLYDASRNRYNLSQAQSAITSLSYESESAKRTISNEVNDAQAYMYSSQQKIAQFELQLKTALKAYSLAETSFKSGTITNLDLLYANTSVSESRLLLLKARIDYVASVYKLKVALGERIY
jgi:outer membrane protein